MERVDRLVLDRLDVILVCEADYSRNLVEGADGFGTGSRIAGGEIYLKTSHLYQEPKHAPYRRGGEKDAE